TTSGTDSTGEAQVQPSPTSEADIGRNPAVHESNYRPKVALQGRYQARQASRRRGGMDETRKLARTGNEKVVRAPDAKAPQSPQWADATAAAAKIAELQAELEALKQSYIVVVDELNAKVDALQAENESRKHEMKGLNSALQWAYAVEEIPRQHWLERGHSEEYADAMENLLDGMKQGIKDLRVGGIREIIIIDFDIQDEDENYIRADHDESLMPYWKEFAAALRHWSEYHADGKCLQVGIRYIDLPTTVLDILRPAFQQSRIKLVYLGDSRHAGHMADFAKKVLQANHFITQVGFGIIKFAQEDVETICGAIKSRNAGGHIIKGLVLHDCFDDGIDTHTLKLILGTVTAVGERDALLNLCDNWMSSREAAIIATFLNSNPSLNHLCLDENLFDDADAAVLANSLLRNTSLKEISVENNGMKENGRLAFLRAIFDVSSLHACAASNHTCSVDGLERDISILNSHKSDSVNKWRKIFAMLALSSEDSFINTALLRGVPAQLIPMILDKCNDEWCTDDYQELTDIYLELTNTARCQKHDDWDSLGKRKSLNCMYNLMKSWVVPSIFV
ncbi:hypothetical protein THAOC_22563, partial [Thalassiosira oceanica]